MFRNLRFFKKICLAFAKQDKGCYVFHKKSNASQASRLLEILLEALSRQKAISTEEASHERQSGTLSDLVSSEHGTEADVWKQESPSRQSGFARS